ncbi:pyridoxine/pyridoxamine 5'-phosphate oxidase [Streptomyces palmae]|nr:pyridoxal 5'-phosphate synthase [Streptomyces palmae]
MGELPPFDAEQAPPEPLPLFRRWLREAAEAGAPEPHTMTLATADAAGRPSLRTVMLHDADGSGWHFATHRTSRKGRELAERPWASLGFYWAVLGRQVRVSGPVTAASPEESAADLRRRSPAALVAALVGRQSEVLDSRRELADAFREARARAEREPETAAATWTLYVLEPEEVEFYQGDPDRQHVRLRYRRHPGTTDPDVTGRTDDTVPPTRSGASTRDHGTGDGPAGIRWHRELLWP